MNIQRTFQVLEVANTFGILEDTIMLFIKEEWIVPFDRKKLELDEEDVERIRLICELQDLGANNDSVPIILHLIDQLNLYHQGLRH